MKMNKSSDTKTIVCPVCGKTTEVVRVYSIPIDESPILLHDDVGEVYQCGHADCMAYLLLVRNKYVHISKFDLLKRQKEITDLLAAEAGIARARLFPREAEIAMRAEIGRSLSPLLYHYTSETPYYRAYSVDELLDACAALGFNPSDVGSRQIGFLLTWLQEHKK